MYSGLTSLIYYITKLYSMILLGIESIIAIIFLLYYVYIFSESRYACHQP